MEIVERLNNKYDPDTRRGIIEIICRYIYVEEPKITCIGLMKTFYYLSIGRIFEPENDYVRLFRHYWREEEELERLMGDITIDVGEGLGEMSDDDISSDEEEVEGERLIYNARWINEGEGDISSDEEEVEGEDRFGGTQIII